MNSEEPGKIGNVGIRNRIVMAPMISNLGDPRGITNEDHSEYLISRARGGAGLIISEYSYVNDRNARGSLNQLGFYSRTFIPKFRRLTERIHENGAKIFTQLVHTGGKALNYVNRENSVAPSSLDYMGRTPAELTKSEISDIIEDFVEAARIAQISKFDGIEIHGAHGYLAQEFLSPALNRREDEYGGTFEKRLKFPQDLIDVLKDEFEFPIGIRLSLYEDDPDGYDPEYGLKIGESLRSVDYVHFSAGRNAPPGSSASFYSNPVHIAARMPRKPKVTTMVVGSVRNSPDVQKVLKVADFVSVGRAFLADSHFASKILSNDHAIRPCIRCNQACRDLSYGEVRCTVNPDTGFERSIKIGQLLSGDLEIAGAGIKGMEAALYASRHGMNVHLIEKTDRVGGQLLQITDPMKKRDFDPLLEYYKEALSRANVNIVTGEKYSGNGLYCLPDVEYRKLPDSDVLTVDSNIYRHHDEILVLAGHSEVKVSKRSLDSLDRVRRTVYSELLKERGVEIIDDPAMEFDVSINERDQYDIRSAMISGRNVVDKYISENRNLYL